MNEDRLTGNAKNLGGQVEEGFGRATGDVKTQLQGKAKQMEGALQAFNYPQFLLPRAHPTLYRSSGTIRAT